MILSNAWNHLTLLTCKIELLEIELFGHLTVCKQVTDIESSCWCFVAVLEYI